MQLRNQTWNKVHTHRNDILIQVSKSVENQYTDKATVEDSRSKSSVVASQSRADLPLKLLMSPGADPDIGGLDRDFATSNDNFPTIPSIISILPFPQAWDFNNPAAGMPEPIKFARQKSSPKNKASGDSMVTPNNTLNLPSEYTLNTGCFSCVLGVAISLSVMLAMTSLLLLLCLSRKGQYIWVQTVNIAGLQNQITQQETSHRSHHKPHNNGPESDAAEERGNEISSRQDIENIDESVAAPRQDAERREISETASRHGTENANMSGVASRHGPQSPVLPLPGEWVTPELSTPKTPKPGFFKRWFSSNHTQTIIKKPGVFQRWFSWKPEKHVNFDDAPLRGAKNGRKIHSARVPSGGGSPDPTVILTEVAERLVRERMRQLSTILSVNEEEEALAAVIDPGEGGEASSMSSIRAIATGSTIGAQRWDNTVRRNRHGVMRTFSDMDGVTASFPVSTTDESTAMQEGAQKGELFDKRGNELKGKSARSVRFDESADNIKAGGRGGFGGASIKQYLFSGTEDDEHSAIGTSSSEDITVNLERAGSMWEGISSEASDNNNSMSGNSTISGVIGVDLERQLKRGVEARNSGIYASNGSNESSGGGGSGESGSSIGDDSTLTVSSKEIVGLVVADSQLPMEEIHRPKLSETVATSGFGMGSDLVLNQPWRIRYNTVTEEEVVTDECGVNAFSLRAKSPRWDSQTSNADSELGDNELSSGYLTGSTSGNDSMGHDPGVGSFTLPADHIKQVKKVESEMTIHRALNG